MKKRKFEKIIEKVAKKAGKLSPYQRLKKFKPKKSGLKVKLPYKKGEKILSQRSSFFKGEYEKEKALLSWS